MVNKNFEVVCTDDPSKASQFYVIPNDDDDDQFGIAYEAKSSQQNVMPTTCYLSAPANLSGLNPGPLTVTERPTTEDLNLTIESRLTRYSVPVDLDKWVSVSSISRQKRKMASFTKASVSRDQAETSTRLLLHDVIISKQDPSQRGCRYWYETT